MRKSIACAAVIAAALALPAAASAQDPIVEVHDRAKLLKDGSVRVKIDVTCEPFGDSGENNITITQDDQRTFAQRSIGVLRCDGRRHTYTVVATPFDGAFHRGEATASAFVSQIDSTTGASRQGQDFEAILVR